MRAGGAALRREVAVAPRLVGRYLDDGRSGSRPLGGAASVLVLVVETVLFDLSASHLATSNTAYGASAGGIILLLWIWLAATAFLCGAELDAARPERRS